MKEPLFTGVCTALVTPFLNGQINYPMLDMLISRQIEANIPAIVLAGTTGEAPTLSDNEKIELFHRGKLTAGNRCKIIAGTGSNNTAHAIALSIDAEKAGADALLVVSPYYNKSTPDGLFAHYIAIAHAVTIPLIIYNVPSRTGMDIPVSVYQRLSRVPNIIGVKEASTDITKFMRIRTACGPEFTIWTGNDDLTVGACALGAAGVISVTSNLLPNEVSDMTIAALNGDFDTAADLQCKLQALNDLLFCQVNPIPIKAAMKIIGYDCGSCRLPLSGLALEYQQQIEALLK